MRGLLLTLSLCGAVIAAGCGSSGGDPDTDPASLAPARAPVYAEVSLEADEDFKAVASKLSGKADPASEIVKLFETSVNEGGGENVSWEKDIEPWIGDRLGIFFTSFADEDEQGAIVAPTEDADKAEKWMAANLKEQGDGDKKPQISDKKYKDVEYHVDSANDNAYALLDGTAVVGSEQGVKGAIDAQDGESLAETDGLKTARDQVEDDGLVFAYAAIRELASSVGGAEVAQLEQLLGAAGDRIAISGDVEDSAIEMEIAQLGVKNPINADPGSLLAEMPGDAWLAGGFAQFGKTIEQGLKQIEATPDGQQLSTALSQLERSTGIDVRADVLSWIGDIGFFVRGTSINDLGGALVVAASDPAKPKKLLGDLQQLAKAAGDASLRPLDRDGVEGVTIRTDEIPMPVHVGVAESKLVVAVGDESLKEAVAPSSKLTESQPYKDATASLDDVKPSFFANLEPVRSLIEASGALQQAGEDAEAIKRVLDHLTTLAGGSTTEGDVQKTKFAIQVK